MPSSQAMSQTSPHYSDSADSPQSRRSLPTPTSPPPPVRRRTPMDASKQYTAPCWMCKQRVPKSVYCCYCLNFLFVEDIGLYGPPHIGSPSSPDTDSPHTDTSQLRRKHSMPFGGVELRVSQPLLLYHSEQSTTELYLPPIPLSLHLSHSAIWLPFSKSKKRPIIAARCGR
eukprot:GHVN01010124.1.p1 GENE.GHVN01010124.1~~GHVN01010124.1.p1  ORF type:complete len:171 (-),score=34.00 GHVN01010124.1:1119-1631(-)